MKIRLKNTKADRGTLAFTLIEVLLAIAILGGIMTAVFASWTAILRGSKVGLDAAAEAQRERITQDCINTTLSSAVLFQQNIQYYAFIADTSNDRFAFLSLVAQLPESFPGAGLFGDHSLRRVTFSVEATNHGSALIMQQSALLVPTNADEAGYKLVLADDVTKFLVEFWDTNLNDWTSDWVLSNALPRMVKVTLGFGKPKNSLAGGAAENDLYSVVSLAGTTITPDIQIGTGGLNLPGQRGPVRPPGAPPPPPPIGSPQGIRGGPNGPAIRGNISMGGGYTPNIPSRPRWVWDPTKNQFVQATNPPAYQPVNQVQPPLSGGGGIPLKRYTNSIGIYNLITGTNGVVKTNYLKRF